MWDQFSAHLTPKVNSKVRALNTDVAVIPGGLTGVLQPLDVSMNKPFKAGLRHRWQGWMASDAPKPCTKAGNLKAPGLDTLAQWVLDSWNDIKSPIIVKSFKKCCISNAMDGTEDDILWEHNLQDKEAEPVDDGADVLATEDDPYEDEIPQSEWEELFNGRHAADA